ncbi:MAG: 6-pyruvoyl tetrahydropterin synthase family protein [Phycisphaerae bacterium]
MRLSREVRFFAGNNDDGAAVSNTWSGTAVGGCAGPFRRMVVEVEGTIDPQTGFLCNIAELDTLLLKRVIPHCTQDELRGSATVACIGSALIGSFQAAQTFIPEGVRLAKLRLFLSPFLQIHVLEGETAVIHLTQSFEFSAAHRLYCASLTEAENRRVFGKCAHPNGHGHNYVLDVTIAGTPDTATGTLIELPGFDKIVRASVVDYFDHKHLNLDCEEFHDLNPSVENIARVIWNRLVDPLHPATLETVRVWETPKTCAVYQGR